jgi:hypothetical protein
VLLFADFLFFSVINQVRDEALRETQARYRAE